MGSTCRYDVPLLSLPGSHCVHKLGVCEELSLRSSAYKQLQWLICMERVSKVLTHVKDGIQPQCIGQIWCVIQQSWGDLAWASSFPSIGGPSTSGHYEDHDQVQQLNTFDKECQGTHAEACHHSLFNNLMGVTIQGTCKLPVFHHIPWMMMMEMRCISQVMPKPLEDVSLSSCTDRWC
jgi:hypothetical protein